MYVSTLALTLTNPTTILSFAALFASLGLGGDEHDPSTAPAMVLGVFLGSGLVDCVVRGFAVNVGAGGIPVVLAPVGQHGVENGGVNGGRGVVVEVDRVH